MSCLHIEELECSAAELIGNNLSGAALYEQLAEECVELAHAALKYARILRDENPTPKNIQEVEVNLQEEFNDLMLSAQVLYLSPDEKLITLKEQRWINRILAKNNNKEEGEK